MQGISQIEADLIFAKLTGTAPNTMKNKTDVKNNQHGRMDFEVFINALAQVSCKVYPQSHDEREALEMLIQNNLPVVEEFIN